MIIFAYLCHSSAFFLSSFFLKFHVSLSQDYFKAILIEIIKKWHDGHNYIWRWRLFWLYWNGRIFMWLFVVTVCSWIWFNILRHNLWMDEILLLLPVPNLTSLITSFLLHWFETLLFYLICCSSHAISTLSCMLCMPFVVFLPFWNVLYRLSLAILLISLVFIKFTLILLQRVYRKVILLSWRLLRHWLFVAFGVIRFIDTTVVIVTVVLMLMGFYWRLNLFRSIIIFILTISVILSLFPLALSHHIIIQFGQSL